MKTNKIIALALSAGLLFANTTVIQAAEEEKQVETSINWDNEISTLKVNIEKRMSVISASEDDIEKYTAEKTRLENIIADKEKEISENENKIATITDEASKRELNGRITKLTGDISELKRNIGFLNEEINNRTAWIKDSNRDIRLFEAKLKRAEANKATPSNISKERYEAQTYIERFITKGTITEEAGNAYIDRLNKADATPEITTIKNEAKTSADNFLKPIKTGALNTLEKRAKQKLDVELRYDEYEQRINQAESKADIDAVLKDIGPVGEKEETKEEITDTTDTPAEKTLEEVKADFKEKIEKLVYLTADQKKTHKESIEKAKNKDQILDIFMTAVAQNSNQAGQNQTATTVEVKKGYTFVKAGSYKTADLTNLRDRLIKARDENKNRADGVKYIFNKMPNFSTAKKKQLDLILAESETLRKNADIAIAEIEEILAGE